jgi:anaerobic magnesium-protoporphyrin IX monomethyl ester cyclase
MKILLCCTTIEDAHRSEDNHDSHYPLGLAYLQSYVEQQSPQHEFENLYLNNVPYEQCFSEIKESLERFQPDVLGVSLMTHSRVSAYRIIEYVHETYPNIKIVTGGMHVTVMWKQFVEKYPYVIVVQGEGEVTFNELISCFESGESHEDVLGLAYWKDNKVKFTGGRPLIKDLDMLPFPRHDIFLYEGKTMANLLTSRGCPYKCNFCVLDAMSRRKVRFRSGENIADEVEQLLEQCPTVDTIWIHDDAFMINKKRTIEFCDAIIERGIKTKFVASARFRPISPEVVNKMEQAGFVHVLFGLESGADAVQKGMKKGITKEHARYALSLIAKTKIKATAFLISGLPGETQETIKETIDFVQELQKLHYIFYDEMGLAMIYPGTEMYTMAKATGKIDDDYWLTDKGVPYYTTENGGAHSYDQLFEWKEEIRQSISLTKFFTPDGFLAQRKLMPEILRYSDLHHLSGFLEIMGEAINSTGLVSKIVQNALQKEPKNMLPQISKTTEKFIIKALFKQYAEFFNIKEKKRFMEAYDNQVKADNIKLKQYEERINSISYDADADEGDIKYESKVTLPLIQ